MINLLELNGECIAAQFGLLFDGVLYLLKIGYRESHARLAPGFLLFERLLEECSAGGPIHTVNIGTGPDWSHSWRPESVPVWEYSLFNTTIHGRLAYLWARLRRVLVDLSGSKKAPSSAGEQS
jgi:CelD/BcsL family acetyltransferase involved in cellulose biosynthesis